MDSWCHLAQPIAAIPCPCRASSYADAQWWMNHSITVHAYLIERKFTMSSSSYSQGVIHTQTWWSLGCWRFSVTVTKLLVHCIVDICLSTSLIKLFNEFLVQVTKTLYTQNLLVYTEEWYSVILGNLWHLPMGISIYLPWSTHLGMEQETSTLTVLRGLIPTQTTDCLRGAVVSSGVMRQALGGLTPLLQLAIRVCHVWVPDKKYPRLEL